MTSASKKVELIVDNDRFTNMITAFIILNTLFLSFEQYDQPEYLTKASDVANYIFTVIFALEMCLKIFGLGVKRYLQDGFNIFDCIVVILSLVELV
jgi:hypothetical protein